MSISTSVSSSVAAVISSFISVTAISERVSELNAAAVTNAARL